VAVFCQGWNHPSCLANRDPWAKCFTAMVWDQDKTSGVVWTAYDMTAVSGDSQN